MQCTSKMGTDCSTTLSCLGMRKLLCAGAEPDQGAEDSTTRLQPTRVMDGMQHQPGDCHRVCGYCNGRALKGSAASPAGMAYPGTSCSMYRFPVISATGCVEHVTSLQQMTQRRLCRGWSAHDTAPRRLLPLCQMRLHGAVRKGQDPAA